MNPSKLKLYITEDDKTIVAAIFAIKSTCPSHGSVIIELTEFLDSEKDNKGSGKYLFNAFFLYSLIKSGNALDELSDDVHRRLKILAKSYIALRNLSKIEKKLDKIYAKYCTIMITAAFRASSIIKKDRHSILTKSDFDTLKEYLIAAIPPECDLLAFPERMKNKIRPFFELLHLVINLSSSKSEYEKIHRLYIKLYGDENKNLLE